MGGVLRCALALLAGASYSPVTIDASLPLRTSHGRIQPLFISFLLRKGHLNRHSQSHFKGTSTDQPLPHETQDIDATGAGTQDRRHGRWHARRSPRAARRTNTPARIFKDPTPTPTSRSVPPKQRLLGSQKSSQTLIHIEGARSSPRDGGGGGCWSCDISSSCCTAQ